MTFTSPITSMKNLKKLLLASSILTYTVPASALTGVNPTGVNVRMQGPTSVFVTFQGTNQQTTTDAFWCSRLVPGVSGGSVVGFNPCVPGTMLGNLPRQFDLSRNSGTNGQSNFTDIMTIPATVARKAYQSAKSGGNSGFFYIRRFVGGAGGTQYGVVTCRLSSGGARSPLALMNVQLLFEDQDRTLPVTFFKSREEIKPFLAKINFNGSGRLIGRWEIVQPGDPEPTQFDLLPAASLPLEERSRQMRYRELSSFDIYLPPTGEATISGPSIDKLKELPEGDYRILLRIGASSAVDSLSATNTGLVSAGGVSGFSIPFLRYNVSSKVSTGQKPESSSVDTSNLTGLPEITKSFSTASVSGKQVNTYSWSAVPKAHRYLISFFVGDKQIYNVIVPGTQNSYESNPSVLDSLASDEYTWSVVAVDESGDKLAISQ